MKTLLVGGVNKQRLINVLKDSSTLSINDIVDLKALAKNHPYSQLLHALIAKGSYNHATKDAQSQLHIAAMYATDRKVLKSLFSSATTTIKSQPQSAIKKQQSIQTTSSKAAKSEGETSVVNIQLKKDYAEALRAEVMRDLEHLVEAKKTYSNELDQLTIAKKNKSSNPSPNKTKTTTSKKITSTKSTSNTQSAKTKETINQIDIIDDFIKKEPSITKKIKERKSTKSTQEDLSEPSAQFGDDLISENLAQILTRQGKNEKAIDIYKKLIWKFPQKKAYFATQIEVLKK